MRYFLLIVVLLSGCTSAPPAPVKVNIPVFTPCVKAAPPRPAFEFPLLPATASAGEKVIAMARDTLRHFKYEGELEAVVAGCL